MSTADQNALREKISCEVPFGISDPQLIPVQRYYDEDFFKLECERLWPHVWQMACRLEQIPNTGDWVEYSNLGKSVIIVNTEQGIKAFHNACRHRGVPLVNEGHGHCDPQGFVCPFHGWTWNKDGENTFVYGRHMFDEALLNKEDLALISCRVELWGNCAFINFDDDAPSLRDCLGPVAERLEAHGVNELRAEWWYATTLPANWKVAMEAFQEGYHVMKTHPQLQRAVPALYNSMYGHDTGGIGQPINPNLSVRENIKAQFNHMELLSEGMAGMCHAKEVEIARHLQEVDLPDDPAEAVMTWFGIVQHQITEQLRARGENVPDLNAVAVSDPVKAVEFIFPHYFLLPFFTSMSSYRIRPLGPESCRFEIWSLTHIADGEDYQAPMEPVELPYDSDEFPMIPRQDYSNIPKQQKGLHSKGFDFMRLSKDIEGLISNYQQLVDGYLKGADKDKLAEENHKLGAGFDGPIQKLDV